ncbi:helix-turn-helix domain-containing protein [Enterococcus faecalis]|jgi:transcriptional regulator with XRE-family HTH domain|uniref:helix-turn-helix domain-containing protein n=1 Tax=Enterococcus faecalis TaxID=1351 RepID=UPI001E4AB159|nr:helix-turn-helix transcriptional regulator [Enterococcus faecalis]
MIDLEKKLVTKVSERCKKLRTSSTYRQDDIADKASISKIENGKYKSGDNFITDTVLEEYSTIFNISKEEIIFGKEDEFEELLLDFFFDLFRLISRRDLSEDINNPKYYREGAFDVLDIEIQRAVISLANSFAEYNLQYYNFLKTDEGFMDCVDKDLDQYFYIDGKLVNLVRDFRNKPINEDIVIDQSDMGEKIWLICKEKFIRSFKAGVVLNLFDDFKYSSINNEVNKWIKGQFIQIIVPELVGKLKSNSILKIGYMVKNLIDDFLNEDLSESFQTTIPLQIRRPKYYNLSIQNNASFHNLSEDERKKRDQLFNEALELHRSGKMLDLKTEELEKYERYGIYFREVPETIKTREVDIDAVINQAIVSKSLHKTKAELRPIIEESPIIKISDFNSEEEIMEFYDDWYDSTHFTNTNIPGYLTNNSQISHRWQQRLNKEIRESIENFIVIQNNLLRLLTEEELIKFGK